MMKGRIISPFFVSQQKSNSYHYNNVNINGVSFNYVLKNYRNFFTLNYNTKSTLHNTRTNLPNFSSINYYRGIHNVNNNNIEQNNENKTKLVENFTKKKENNNKKEKNDKEITLERKITKEEDLDIYAIMRNSKYDQNNEFERKKRLENIIKAADEGNIEEQYNLSSLYYFGKGIEKNIEKSMEYLKKAANGGNINAQFHLAIILKDGEEGVEVDIDNAFKYFEMAAERGNFSAQYEISQFYFNDSKFKEEISHSIALQYLQNAADNGNPLAQAKLAYLLYSELNNNFSIDNNNDELNNNNNNNINKEKLEKMIKYFHQSAEQSNSYAQYMLAKIYYNGEFGVSKDFQLAIEYLQKSSDLGNSESQFNLGMIFFNGENNVKKDVKKASELFVNAAKSGKKEAKEMIIQIYFDNECEDLINKKIALECLISVADFGSTIDQFNLAFLYEKGEKIEKNEKLAIKYYKLAADSNFAPSFTPLALLLFRQSPPDFSSSFCYFSKSAQKGDPLALNYTANFLFHGKGVAKNISLAISIFEKAILLDDLQSMYDLATIYHFGKENIEKDLKKAKKFYYLAAEKGHKFAQFNLAMIMKISDSSSDHQLAFKYFIMAADQDLDKAICQLADCFDQGIGVDQNKEMAFDYYKRSADQNGNENSQYRVGVCYYKGEGVIADREKSLFYLRSSAKQFYQPAISFLKSNFS